jgi:SAM-dependent methyltransferase
MTNDQEADRVRERVRDAYAEVARASTGGDCCGEANSCCGVPAVPIGLFSTRLGYSALEVGAAPAGSDMGLGCGNPRAIAALAPGEVVLDLGSGGGFDCFLAAREVGETGRVIGVDMTPEMVSKARANAVEAGLGQVEFRLGEIEHLPVADASIDVIISNCVINLSPDKPQVFRECFRVLEPGGRLAVSDTVATAELPESLRNDPVLHAGCMAGATPLEALEAMLREAGFVGIIIEPKDESRTFIKDWAPGRGVEDYVLSAYIRARKP